MCAELLIKKHASLTVFDLVKLLARQQRFSMSFVHENSLITLAKHLKHPEARAAAFQVVVNGGLLAKIQAIAYVMPGIYSYSDPTTMNLLEELDSVVFNNFDIFLAMVDFGNIYILKGVLLICSVYQRTELLHKLLCTSTLRLDHVLSIDDNIYRQIVECAMFSLVSPAPLPVIEFYINHTLPNLIFKNEGDFTIKCKDGDLKCHRLVLESAETEHFRSSWLVNSNEYTEDEYETTIIAEMLKYLYCGECQVSFALCRYADKIRMQHLCDFCAIKLTQDMDQTTFEPVLGLITDCYISSSKRIALQCVLGHYYVCNYSKIENAKKILKTIMHWVGSFVMSYSN